MISYVRGELTNLKLLRADQVFAEDIAECLSKICRFNGRVPYPYSVAQHALLVGALCRELHEMGQCADPPDVAEYEGLHHDDTEAYIGDVCSPVKRECLLRDGPSLNWEPYTLSDMEARMRRTAIAPALSLAPVEPSYVKVADNWALRLEQIILQGRTGVEAAMPETFKVKDYLRPMHWRYARDAWLDRHLALMPEAKE